MGCIADAAKIRERADGSFEVLATGTTRVRLLSVDASGRILTAEVEELPEDAGRRRPARSPRGSCGPSAATRSGWPGRGERSLTTGADLPDDPSVVSYLVAAAAVLDIPAKQRLLQAPDTATRLREELTLLRAETAVIGICRRCPPSDLTRAPHPPQLTPERGRPMAKKPKKQQQPAAPRPRSR